MLISSILVMALFAAPAGDAAPAPDVATEARPAAAEAKPEMQRVCVKVAVENSRAPRKKCRMVPAPGSGSAAAE